METFWQILPESLRFRARNGDFLAITIMSPASLFVRPLPRLVPFDSCYPSESGGSRSSYGLLSAYTRPTSGARPSQCLSDCTCEAENTVPTIMQSVLFKRGPARFRAQTRSCSFLSSVSPSANIRRGHKIHTKHFQTH